MGLSIPEVARVDLEWQARLEFDYSEWVEIGRASCRERV